MSLTLKRRHPSRSSNWYIRGTVRGISVDESTGTSDRRAAETIKVQREVEILNRSVFGREATATFLEAAVMYMEAGGERRFLEPIIHHFKTTPLARIDQAAIDHAAASIYPDASPATRNRQFYTPCSAVLNRAAKCGLCEKREIARPSQPMGRIRWLKPDEAEGLFRFSGPHLRPLNIFMIYEGARVGEALWLDWRDVDLQRAHVTFLDTKNGETRGVPLHPRVVAELANLPHRTGAVFRRPDGRPYTRPTKIDDTSAGTRIKTAFKSACRRAGIENFRPHDCRHTWATWHYAANRDLVALMKLGGWKSERMVLRYAHINVSELAPSIERLPWGKSGNSDIENRKIANVTKA